MAKDQFAQYQSYMQSVRRLALFVGLWPTQSQLFQRLCPAINSLCFGLMSCLILNFCRYHITNLSLMTKGMSIAVSYSSTLFKMTYFVLHRKSVQEIHETLDRYFGEELARPKMHSVILSHIGVFAHCSFVFITATFGVCAVYMITPGLSMILQRLHGEQEVKHLLIFPSKYPWSVTSSEAVFSLHYAMETYGSISLSAATCAVDSLFGFYVFQMCGILAAITHRMANLTHLQDYRSVIRECVRRHQALTRCCDILESVYGATVICIVITNSVVICALIFQASLLSNLSLGKIVLFALYISMKLLQTLTYSWCGSILTTESENFCQAVYSSGWPDTDDRSFAKHAQIIMTQRPLVLTACSVTKISMDMFISVTNTALSYFFLLRTLDEKA